MGNTNHLSDASGNVLTSTLETDAFGVETYRANPGIGITTRSGFAGAWGYENEGGGINLVGNRWYDADAERFLTRDPARQGSNWWNYCDNDPVNAVDPAGLEKRDMNKWERIRILKMIGDLYDHGFKTEAKALLQMTKENRIRIQTGSDEKMMNGSDTYAITRHLGENTIYLSKSKLGDSSLSEIFWQSTLLHERIHTIQNEEMDATKPFGYLLVPLFRGLNLENGAYDDEERFLKQRRKSAKTRKEREDIDYILDEVKSNRGG